MKIVHTEASCGWGGQEIRILEESKGLIERGHEVRILCPSASHIHSEAERWGVPVDALPIGHKNLTGLRAMREWLKSHHVDVLNTHSSTDSWLAAVACATLRNAPPIVRTRHISAPIPDNCPTRWLYVKATRHIVTTGEALRQELIRRNGYPESRITSIPTGIDAARFSPGDKHSARAHLGLDPELHYIGIVATLRSWKGHLYLLDAFASLALPHWRLLIVGDGPMRDNIKRKIADLGIADRVVLAGQQRQPELWLRAMDIFCLPSYANEGVPQALLQAMLTGLPIVTTAVGSIGEAIDNGTTGLIVASRSSTALVDAISRAIADENLARHLGTQALATARDRFTRNRMLDAMEACFHSVVMDRGL